MNKLLIPLDKANHFIYGFLIYYLSNFIFDKYTSLNIVIIIAVLKEVIYDGLMKKGTPDYKDIIYTIIPGLLLMIKY